MNLLLWQWLHAAYWKEDRDVVIMFDMTKRSTVRAEQHKTLIHPSIEFTINPVCRSDQDSLR